MENKVIWVTGLSASGKSTLASEMQKLLCEKKITSVLLDGDQIREAIGDSTCGHDHDSRVLNAYRISRLANMISKQSIIVIVATMSLYHEVHSWNRENISGYFEVYVKASLETLKRRDPKGLYHKITEGKVENMPGVDLTPQFPKYPDFEFTNDEDQLNVRSIAIKILNAAKLYEG